MAARVTFDGARVFRAPRVIASPHGAGRFAVMTVLVRLADREWVEFGCVTFGVSSIDVMARLRSGDRVRVSGALAATTDPSGGWHLDVRGATVTRLPGVFRRIAGGQ